MCMYVCVLECITAYVCWFVSMCAWLCVCVCVCVCVCAFNKALKAPFEVCTKQDSSFSTVERQVALSRQ